MGYIVYILCALTSLGCTILLFGRYKKTGVQLLFWSSFAFLAFTITNTLLFIDLVLLGPARDLALWRNLCTLIGICVLLYALINDNT